MRIAHICEAFSPLSETFIYDQITELEAQGEECHVITLRRENEASRPFPRVHALTCPWNLQRVRDRMLVSLGRLDRERYNWPQLRPELEHRLREIKPDVIHAHFGPLGVFALPTAIAMDIPIITSFYGYDVSSLIKDPSWVQHYHRLFDAATALIGISHHVCNTLTTLGAPRPRVQLLHLGVRTDSFLNISHTYADSDTIECLHIGRLVEKKSPILLVKALQIASNTLNGRKRINLTIAGDGPMQHQLQELVRHTGQKDSVRLIGPVSHAHVPQLLASADIYTQHCITASNGDQEGLGVSFVEASAAGLPVVSTLHDGIPDVVLDGSTGFLVQERDFISMGERIAALALDPSMRAAFGQAARRHVQKHFELSAQTEKLRTLYRYANRNTLQ